MKLEAWNRFLCACCLAATVVSLSGVLLPGEAEDYFPNLPTGLKPYSKQQYLALPDYYTALSQAKKDKQAKKAAHKSQKALEKAAKTGRTIPKEPAPSPAGYSESDFVAFTPYQAGKELDLWRLEARRFVRSEPVMPPDRSGYAYTEVGYLPHSRQTFSRLFWVPLTPEVKLAPLLPSETPETQYTQSPDFHQDRYNPDKTTQIRQEILGVGNNRSVTYEFRTLTIIDWSANSQRLLFKQRKGVLHMGLKVSDVLVYDRNGGTVTIYPELERVLQHYWIDHSTLPDLDTVAWDIYPIGWAAGSDSVVVFKAWAYNKAAKKELKEASGLAYTDLKVVNGAPPKILPEKVFLGVWEYDIDAQQSRLITKDAAALGRLQAGIQSGDSPVKLPVNAIVPDFVSPTGKDLPVPQPIPVLEPSESTSPEENDPEPAE